MNTELTEKQISEITYGYNWNPTITYEDFIRFNPQLSCENSWDLFNKIDENYILAVHEQTSENV